MQRYYPTGYTMYLARALASSMPLNPTRDLSQRATILNVTEQIKLLTTHCQVPCVLQLAGARIASASLVSFQSTSCELSMQ